MTKKFLEEKQRTFKPHVKKIKLKTQIKKAKKNSTKTKILDFDKILKVLFGVSPKKRSNYIPSLTKKQTRSELYDINNFLSHNVMKITEKNNNALINIECPKFRELTDKEITSYDRTVKIKENVNDIIYIKYHKIFENKELQYRLIEKTNKKKSETNKNNKPALDMKLSNSVSTSPVAENIPSSGSSCSLQKKEQCLFSLFSFSESAETAIGDKM